MVFNDLSGYLFRENGDVISGNSYIHTNLWNVTKKPHFPSCASLYLESAHSVVRFNTAVIGSGSPFPAAFIHKSVKAIMYVSSKHFPRTAIRSHYGHPLWRTLHAGPKWLSRWHWPRIRNFHIECTHLKIMHSHFLLRNEARLLVSNIP